MKSRTQDSSILRSVCHRCAMVDQCQTPLFVTVTTPQNRRGRLNSFFSVLHSSLVPGNYVPGQVQLKGASEAKSKLGSSHRGEERPDGRGFFKILRIGRRMVTLSPVASSRSGEHRHVRWLAHGPIRLSVLRKSLTLQDRARTGSFSVKDLCKLGTVKEKASDLKLDLRPPPCP